MRLAGPAAPPSPAPLCAYTHLQDLQLCEESGRELALAIKRKLKARETSVSLGEWLLQLLSFHSPLHRAPLSLHFPCPGVQPESCSPEMNGPFSNKGPMQGPPLLCSHAALQGSPLFCYFPLPCCIALPPLLPLPRSSRQQGGDGLGPHPGHGPRRWLIDDGADWA